MKRREFLGVLSASALAGCSQLTGFLGDRSLEESVSFGEVEVTATDAMTASTIELHRQGESATVDSPPNGVFGLFNIEAYNPDITDRNAPGINLANYTKLTEGENEIVIAGINDIRVYGSGEGGHLPDAFYIDSLGYEAIHVNGVELDTYPATGYEGRPSIGPDVTISGWMFGIIEDDATPQVKVQYNGNSAMWSAESTSLDTPTPSGNTTVSF